MHIEPFFDAETSTLTYVVYDEDARCAVVIDPVLDFDPASGRTSTESADAVCRFLESKRLAVPFVLDTHAHADHLTAMPVFRERFEASGAIGAEITAVQKTFADLYDLGPDFATDGRQFDRLLHDGDRLEVGPFAIEALHTPGHTPACMSYRIGDALFVGDALFQPDYGTARCDFPGGSAAALHASIQRLYRSLPPETATYTCHDYQPEGRPLAWRSTLARQREYNVQLSESTPLDDFIEFRRTRDAGLDMPQLMLAAIQVNIRAGALPAPEANGRAYLKIPLNAFPKGG